MHIDENTPVAIATLANTSVCSLGGTFSAERPPVSAPWRLRRC